MKDNSPMPFGQYKGQPLINVPAHYLLWLYDTNKNKYWFKRDQMPLLLYIEENMDVLKSQSKKR